MRSGQRRRAGLEEGGLAHGTHFTEQGSAGSLGEPEVRHLQPILAEIAAAAGLNLGGGKAVILGDPKRDKSPALMRAMGQAVERLGGRYITAEDVGTMVADFAWVREATAQADERLQLQLFHEPLHRFVVDHAALPAAYFSDPGQCFQSDPGRDFRTMPGSAAVARSPSSPER